MRELREWMRDLMRRRSRRGPNNSESTGKSGQELPQNQPAPLRPSYPEPLTRVEPEGKAVAGVAKPAAVRPAKAETEAAAVPVAVEAPDRRVVVETQPESLATP